VVIGILDPNPDIYNRGVELLNHHGVEVDFFDADVVKEIRRENTNFIDYFERFEYVQQREKGPEESLLAFSGASREEDRPIYQADLSDLSSEAINEYRGKRGLSFELGSPELWNHLWKAGLFVKDSTGQKIYPTLAGLVLFGKNPSELLPHCRVTAQCYQGTPDDGLGPDNLVPEGY